MVSEQLSLKEHFIGLKDPRMEGKFVCYEILWFIRIINFESSKKTMNSVELEKYEESSTSIPDKLLIRKS